MEGLEGEKEWEGVQDEEKKKEEQEEKYEKVCKVESQGMEACHLASRVEVS